MQPKLQQLQIAQSTSLIYQFIPLIQNTTIMGAICERTPTSPELQTPGDIYLSNPQNMTLTQIQKSNSFKASQLSNSFLGKGQSAIILGCREGQNRQYLNKYMLTYLYFLKCKLTRPQQEIKDFQKILKILDEDKKYLSEIQKFCSDYKNQPTPRQKADFLIDSYFLNGFFSSSIEQFPIMSYDPSILGYIRRPLVDLHKGIKSKYEKQPRKKQIYCVIQLTKNQQTLLNKMSNSQDYFTFTTFVRCFSDQEKAKKRQKQLEKIGKSVRDTHKINSSTLFFYIQIQKQDIDKDYDYGFYQDPKQKDNELGDIIMNLMNFFQVTGAQPDNKEYTLKYNGLARIIHMDRARLLQTKPQLLTVNSLIQAKCGQIKTHSNLLRVVNSKELSITASQSLKNSKSLNSDVQDNERINLIQAYLQEKNYDKAIKQCKNTLQFKVRQAQIFYESKKYDKVDSLLSEILPEKNTLKKQHFQEYILYEFISAKRKIAKGESNKAKQQLQLLRECMKKQFRGTYDFRGREVQKLITSCDGGSSKTVEWSNYSQGLNIGIMLSH